MWKSHNGQAQYTSIVTPSSLTFKQQTRPGFVVNECYGGVGFSLALDEPLSGYTVRRIKALIDQVNRSAG